jgi:signal transduction histidine kinase
VELILNASEMQIGTYQPTFSNINLEENISEIIQAEYSALAKQKGLGITLKNNLSSAVFYCDNYSINQIFVNLIDNAVKYTEAGEIEVIIDKNKENNIFVSVLDSGIGITEEYLPHIFEPFMQEERGYSRRFEGNGLGLSLVKRYCDLNGLTISVESSKGAGSKFTVTFAK